MDKADLTDWLQTAAAFLTFFTAVAALIAALRAPKAAAKWADDYRRQSEASAEREKLRTAVFVALMKHRKHITHEEAVGAINLIDVAFADDKKVREAHKSFIQSTFDEPYNEEKIFERYRVLIDKVAVSIGMSEKISVSDIAAGYYPDAIHKLNRAAMITAEKLLASKTEKVEGLLP